MKSLVIPCERSNLKFHCKCGVKLLFAYRLPKLQSLRSGPDFLIKSTPALSFGLCDTRNNMPLLELLTNLQIEGKHRMSFARVQFLLTQVLQDAFKVWFVCAASPNSPLAREHWLSISLARCVKHPHTCSAYLFLPKEAGKGT